MPLGSGPWQKGGSLRWPGIEPGSTAWKAAMLTTIPPTPHRRDGAHTTPPTDTGQRPEPSTTTPTAYFPPCARPGGPNPNHTHGSAAPRFPSPSHARCALRASHTRTHTPFLWGALASCLLQLGAPTQAGAPGATTQTGLARRSSPERRTPPVRAHLEPTAVGVGRGGEGRAR